MPALAALMLLAGLLQAGHRYFYCAAMGELLAAPCCGEQHASRQPDARAPDPPCCGALDVAKLPAGQSVVAAGLPAAPHVATLPTPGVLSASCVAPDRVSSRFAVGPPRSSCPPRAALGVFLI